MMVGFLLVAKALTVVGPLLVLLVVTAERSDSEAEQHYWARKIDHWDRERQREDSAANATTRPRK